MLRLLALALALIGLASFIRQSPPAQLADAREPTDIPFLLFRTDLATCIDFSNQDNCDADGYPGWVELLAGSDPNDPQSTPEFALLDEQAHWAQTCSDGVDNDGDGRSDERDPGCHLTCRDFKAGAGCTDHDHDGWLQYVESWLGSDPNNRASTPENVLNPGSCQDGIDNDLDGRADSGPAGSADDGCDVIVDCIDFDQNDPPCLPF